MADMDGDMMDDVGIENEEPMLEESYERHKGYTQNSDDDMIRTNYQELGNNNNSNNKNNNNNNNNNSNDFDESDEFENIEVPSKPPEKPLNGSQYYVEIHRDKFASAHPDMSPTEIDQKLREQFKELGKTDAQAIKREVKKLKKRFEKELQLYKDHHPEFDDKKWYGDASKSHKNGSGKGRSSRRRGSRNNGNNSGSDSDGASYYGGNSSKRRKRNFEPKSFLMNSFEEAGSDDDIYPSNKRRKKNGDNSNNGDNNGNGNNDGSSQMDAFFASIVKQKGRGRKRKKGDDGENIVIDDSVLTQMRDLCNNMRDKARKDWQCNLSKQPAVNMTGYCEYVTQQLSKKGLKQTFIEDEHCYVLDCIRDWIHPFPDGSLPPILVRQEMYRIIESLELHKMQSCRDYLDKSNERSAEGDDEDEDDEMGNGMNNNRNKQNREGFAKTLMTLWSHKDETNENKSKLRKIILKLIHQLTANMREQEEEDVDRQKEDVRRRNEILNGQKRNVTLAAISGERKRAGIPEKPGFDFAIQPKSSVSVVDEAKGAVSRSQLFEQRFGSRKQTRVTQAIKPSVTGRRY